METLVRENREGARGDWKGHQTVMSLQPQWRRVWKKEWLTLQCRSQKVLSRPLESPWAKVTHQIHPMSPSVHAQLLSCIRQIFYRWATWEAPLLSIPTTIKLLASREAPGQCDLGAEDSGTHQLGPSVNCMPAPCSWRAEPCVFMAIKALVLKTAVDTCSGSFHWLN